MPVDARPQEGAFRYEEELKTLFESDHMDVPAFDLMFLGIGQDGHTASLFPGQSALDEQGKWVMAVKGGNPDVDRLTMTFPVINSASEIVFLAAGKGKAAIVKTVLENKDAGLPAQRIKPVKGQLAWLLDRDAASLLSEETAHGTF
jgi:6-phosphogluconolactonase